MKKMLFGALLCASFGAAAQTENVEIVNTTSCEVNLYFALSEPGSPCFQYHTSGVITVAPGSSVTYNYTNYPGSTATGIQYFAYVKVLNAPLSCVTNSLTVGTSCAAPLSSGSIALNDGRACSDFCGVAHVDWNDGASASGTTTLKIYP